MKAKSWFLAAIAAAGITGIYLFWFVYIRLTPDDRLCQARTAEQVMEALKSGANPNACRALTNGLCRPVIFRVLLQGGDEDSLRALLAAGANPNVRNPIGGETPLLERVSYAMIFREVSPAELRRVRLLLSYGADPCVTNRLGKNVYDLLESRNRDALWVERLEPVYRANWRRLCEIFDQYRSDKANGIKVGVFE